MKTFVSYVYYETTESLYNFEFFVNEGLWETEDVIFILVINGGVCSASIPKYKNVIIINRPNIGFDFGGHNCALNYIKDKLTFDYFIFMNCGVIGPFLPSYYPKILNWTNVFTSKLTDKVKLVGTSIVCLPPPDKGGYGPRVESFCFATDKIGLNIVLQEGTIFYDHKTKYDAIINGEYRLTTILLQKNYTIDCLLYRYQNIDWRDMRNWNINDNIHPSRKDRYGGININPFEVVFHKWYWSSDPNNTVMYDYIDKYKKWKLSQNPQRKIIGAHYGIDENNTKDVTPVFLRHSIVNNMVVINNKFNNYFGDPYPGRFKYLYIHLNNRKYVISENHNKYLCIEMEKRENETLIPQVFSNGKKIIIVYYAYINHASKWWVLIYEQLIHLKETGLLDYASLYIHITKVGIFDTSFQDIIVKINAIVKDAIISTSYINLYEYPGIHLVWELANKYPENIFLYFHSKGMSGNINQRTMLERLLFQEVIVKWKKILNILGEREKINKIGLAASEQGWMWFNFWWARGSYLINCEEPIITPDRYYYEDWLHRIKNQKGTCDDCYSLFEDKANISYTPAMVRQRLNYLVLEE